MPIFLLLINLVLSCHYTIFLFNIKSIFKISPCVTNKMPTCVIMNYEFLPHNHIMSQIIKIDCAG